MFCCVSEVVGDLNRRKAALPAGAHGGSEFPYQRASRCHFSLSSHASQKLLATDSFITCPLVIFETPNFNGYAGQVGEIIKELFYFFHTGELGLSVYVMVYEVLFHCVRSFGL
jgi:hypothetical protein